MSSRQRQQEAAQQRTQNITRFRKFCVPMRSPVPHNWPLFHTRSYSSHKVGLGEIYIRKFKTTAACMSRQTQGSTSLVTAQVESDPAFVPVHHDEWRRYIRTGHNPAPAYFGSVRQGRVARAARAAVVAWHWRQQPQMRGCARVGATARTEQSVGYRRLLSLGALP